MERNSPNSVDRFADQTTARPKPKGRKGIFIVLGVLVLCGLLSFAAFSVWRGDDRGRLFLLLGGRTAPELFDDAILISKSPNGLAHAIAHEGNAFSFADISPEGSSFLVTDAARQGAIRAFLGNTPDGNMAVAVGKKILLSSATKKQNITISPDGTKIAYAELTDAADPNGWNITILDIASGMTTNAYSGFAPFYFPDGTLLRFTSAGIIQENVTATFAGPFLDTSMKISQSPDRTMIALSENSGKTLSIYTLFEGTAAYPPSLTRVTSFELPAPLLASSLENDGFLAVTFEKSPLLTIYTYPLNGADRVKVWQVPVSLSLSGLVTGP